MDVSREQVLAYRAAATGLHRDTPGADGDVTRLGVLDLGAQNTPPGSARLALAARLEVVPDATVSDRWDTDGGVLTMAWGPRGAPHLYRSGELGRLAVALWPRGDADAEARLASWGKELTAAGVSPLWAFGAAVDAWRAVLEGSAGAPMTKGEASGRVSALLPEVLVRWCEGCQVRHVPDGLFTQTALPAGVRLRREGNSLLLSGVPGWDAAPSGQAGTGAVVGSYLRLLGPAALRDVAGFLGTSQAEAAAVWPGDGLAEVRVDGKTGWLPAEHLDALTAAPPAPSARLLPPSDPYLQVRDRELLLPDPRLHKQVWKALNQPGVLLVSGGIAGVWRARAKSKKTLEVTVTPFAPLTKTDRAAAEEEADRLAVARGAQTSEVRLQPA